MAGMRGFQGGLQAWFGYINQLAVQLKNDREREKERGESRERRKERVKNRESQHKAEVRETGKPTRTRGKIISSLSYTAKNEFTKSKGFLKLLTKKKGRLSLVFKGRKAKVFHLFAPHPLHSNKQDPQVQFLVSSSLLYLNLAFVVCSIPKPVSSFALDIQFLFEQKVLYLPSVPSMILILDYCLCQSYICFAPFVVRNYEL